MIGIFIFLSYNNLVVKRTIKLRKNVGLINANVVEIFREINRTHENLTELTPPGQIYLISDVI